MRTFITAGLLLACSTALAGHLTVTDPYPLRGTATKVVVTVEDGSPVEGAVIRLTYRPNSMVARLDSLPPTDFSGTTVWIPSDAGICTMRAYAGGAEIAAKDVSVRFDRFPIQGAIVMIVAFCALFGGAVFSLTMLFKASKAGESDAGILVRGT